MKSFKNSAG